MSKKKKKVEEELSEELKTESSNEDETTNTEKTTNTIEETATEESETDVAEALDDVDEDDEVDKLIKKAEKKEAKKKKKAEKKSAKKKEETKPEDVNIVKELLSLIVYIGIVIILCYVVINYVGCRSKVDGSSMYPTLEDGDNLWVDKLAYRIGDPKRFDVIIFDYDINTTYVKRIIGLPGETVRIDQAGNIYINDIILEEDYGYEPIEPNKIGIADTPIHLGDDEYFVLGDNRNNSRDSRWSDVGNITRDEIVGKVVLRIYPFSSFGKIK